MSEDIYRDLQVRLDGFSFGFPAAASGVEIDLLKMLFTEADAVLFLAMSRSLETAEEIAGRTGDGPDEIAVRLEDMTGRGLLFRMKKGDRARYGAVPFMHGIYEFQLRRMDRDMAALIEAYMLEAFGEAVVRGAAGFVRTVPVQRIVDATPHIAAYEDVCRILRNTEKIVVGECLCRKQQALIDQGCGKPLEVCFMFGAMGQFYLDQGMGRRIEAEEAVRIMKEAQEAGLVTQPATAANPGGICNCCGDCCGVLRSLNRHPEPASLVFSNYFAEADPDLCTGCETCIDRCQMAAIALDDQDRARIDLKRCIGCGLCVMSCPAEALRLAAKPEGRFRTPPADTREQQVFLARLVGRD